MMKYIENLREGDRISGIYLCKTRQSALTKAGKPYENLIFQDKTGTVDGIRILGGSMISTVWTMWIL